MANGYQSSRTGNQTEQLLNRAAMSLVPRNGSLADPGSEGTFASGMRGHIVIVNTVGDSTHTPDVVASSRLTEDNIVIAHGSGFDATSDAGKIVVVAQNGSNSIAVSDVQVSGLVKAAVTLATNNAVIIGTATTNGVAASTRINNDNVVIANTNFSTRNHLLMGGGATNVVTDVTDGITSIEGEIYVDNTSHPKLISRSITIGTIGESGTLSGTYLTNLTNAVGVKNQSLMGSIIRCTYGSINHSAQIICAVPNGAQTMVGAIFATYNNGGIQLKMLTINSTTGAYVVRPLIVDDTTSAPFNVVP